MSGQQGDARRSWPPDDARWRAFIAGYQAGIEHGTSHGHADGYREAMTVLDEAGAFLAAQRPSSDPSFAELQRRRYARTRPALTPAQIRVQSARSWGFTPDPADVAQADADAARQAGAAATADEPSSPALGRRLAAIADASTGASAQPEAGPVAEPATDATAAVAGSSAAELVDEDDWAWSP